MAGIQAVGELAVPDPPDEFQAAVVSRGSAISMGAGEERVARWETLLEVVQVAKLAGLPEDYEELLRELVLGALNQWVPMSPDTRAPGASVAHARDAQS